MEIQKSGQSSTKCHTSDLSKTPESLITLPTSSNMKIGVFVTQKTVSGPWWSFHSRCIGRMTALFVTTIYATLLYQQIVRGVKAQSIIISFLT